MKNVDKILQEISQIFHEKKFSLVTAESCTGGGLAYFITKNPACSSILERGYVVYSPLSKEDVLNVSSYVLQTFGVVSKEVALEMAAKALEKSHAHLSVAITGIDETGAKKDDENKERPGIVWIACAGTDKKSLAKKFEIKGGRDIFCEQAIYHSLKMLLDFAK